MHLADQRQTTYIYTSPKCRTCTEYVHLHSLKSNFPLSISIPRETPFILFYPISSRGQAYLHTNSEIIDHRSSIVNRLRPSQHARTHHGCMAFARVRNRHLDAGQLQQFPHPQVWLLSEMKEKKRGACHALFKTVNCASTLTCTYSNLKEGV